MFVLSWRMVERVRALLLRVLRERDLRCCSVVNG